MTYFRQPTICYSALSRYTTAQLMCWHVI